MWTSLEEQIKISERESVNSKEENKIESAYFSMWGRFYFERLTATEFNLKIRNEQILYAEIIPIFFYFLLGYIFSRPLKALSFKVIV